MRRTHYRSCTLCEATCGVAIEVEGDRVVSIRGDDADPFSKGYICPKAHRARRPAPRSGPPAPARWSATARRGARSAGTRRSISSRRGCAAIRSAHGKRRGRRLPGQPDRAQPRPHDVRPAAAAHARHAQLLLGDLGSISCRTCSRRCTMFGNQLLMPVPDIDRTRSASSASARNPLVVERQHHDRARHARAGSRRSARAAARSIVARSAPHRDRRDADQHLFIRPGTDALLLLAMVHVIFAERLARLGPARAFADGLDELAQVAASCGRRSAPRPSTGIAADDIRELARALATTPRARRLRPHRRVHAGVRRARARGSSTRQRADRPPRRAGRPDVHDAGGRSACRSRARLGFDGGFARWQSRVSRHARVRRRAAGDARSPRRSRRPATGQIRALITSAGNPVLSTPNGAAPRARARARSTSWSRSIRTSTRRRGTRT